MSITLRFKKKKKEEKNSHYKKRCNGTKPKNVLNKEIAIADDNLQQWLSAM